jgi:hypothetical protein
MIDFIVPCPSGGHELFIYQFCEASAKPSAIGPPAQAASSHMQEGGYGADDKRAWSFSTMLCISG